MNGLPYMKPHGNMGNQHSASWSDDEMRDLRALVENKAGSASKIADILTEKFNRDFTRNMICGKIMRMGLSTPKEKKEPTPRRQDRTGRIRKPRPTIVRERPVNRDELALRCIEIEPLNLPLFDLTDTTCRWPYGDRSPYLFCGHTVFEGSYCSGHFYLSMRPGATTERMAGRAA